MDNDIVASVKHERDHQKTSRSLGVKLIGKTTAGVGTRDLAKDQGMLVGSLLASKSCSEKMAVLHRNKDGV